MKQDKQGKGKIIISIYVYFSKSGYHVFHRDISTASQFLLPTNAPRSMRNECRSLVRLLSRIHLPRNLDDAYSIRYQGIISCRSSPSCAPWCGLRSFRSSSETSRALSLLLSSWKMWMARISQRANQNTSYKDSEHLIKANIVRSVAIMMLGVAGYRVIPVAIAGVVPHALRLVEAPSEFLQEAGMFRLRVLLSMERVRSEALEMGAVRITLRFLDERMERLVNEEGNVNGIRDAIRVLVLLSQTEDGLEEIAKENGADILARCVGDEAGLNNCLDSDAVEMAQDLLKDVQRPRGVQRM